MSEFQERELVWAKMAHCAPWPSMIVKPGPHTPRAPKKDSQWVFFFGTDNYAWIPSDKIKPYHAFKEKFVNATKSGGFKKACEKIEEYISTVENDSSYVMPLPPEQPVERPAVPAEYAEKEFNKLVTPKKPKKSTTPLKRRSSDTGSNSLRTSASKRMRLSPRHNENGVVSNEVGVEMLNNPSVIDNPDSQIEMNFSEVLKTKDIKASPRRFGFLGAGNMAQGIIRNLINSGHKINLYNRTQSKVDKIKEQADAIQEGLVNVYITPCDVMENSDIVFSCVSDPKAALANVVDNCGIKDWVTNKGYVEMSGIDPKTSQDIAEIIKNCGGKYLEAQIQGSKTEAFVGSLVVLAAGDESLFIDCQSCFKAMGSNAFYLGEVGYATKTNLVLNVIKGISLVGLAEGLALADRCGISMKDFINIFKMTRKDTYLEEKAEVIANKDFKQVEQALKHMQKDLSLALGLSDTLNHPLLMTATANELYKHTRRLGYDEHDVACIYMRTRH